jgi:hypothetical protein
MSQLSTDLLCDVISVKVGYVGVFEPAMVNFFQWGFGGHLVVKEILKSQLSRIPDCHRISEMKTDESSRFF